MQDLATENEYVQQCVVGYLKELDSIGVDGIRWDAAKHISLPSETDNSAFWPTVTTNSGLGLYNYGEILSGPSSSDSDDYLMGEYTQYISVTDDEYGNDVRESFVSSSAPTGYANWTTTDYVADWRVVYWAESHDTYSNDGGASKEDDQNYVDRAWAVVASRNDATALYFSRPSETDNDEIKTGVKGSTHFTSPEVAAVNHFHNICNGEPDYFSSSDGVVSICRKSGAVIVLGSGSDQEVTAVNGGSYTTAGTYTDEISGNTFTVTEDYITGTVGSTGIAVIYNGSALLPRIILDPDGGSFIDETTVTAKLNSAATSGTLQVGDGEVQTITETTTVTIGEDMSDGDEVTIYWTATDGTQTNSGSSTYTKVEGSSITIYVKADDAPYLYVWDDDGTVLNDSWPGTEMSSTTTIDEVSYYYQTFTDVTSINIILNCGSNSCQTSNIEGITSDTYLTYDGGSTYEIELVAGILPVNDTPLFVYVVNEDEYDNVAVWVWDSSNNYTGGSWPGEQLTNIVATYNGYDVYKWTYDGSLTSTPTGIIVNNNLSSGTTQTADLDYINGAWYTTGGNVLRVYDVIYDETTANGDYNTTGETEQVDVTLVRELSNSYWNTLCLPFSVSEETVTEIFGSGTDIEQFSSVSDTTLYFTQVDAMEAGVPYLIKPGNATVTNPVFYNVTMEETAAKSVEKTSDDNETYTFTGIYSPYDLDPETDMFLSKSTGMLIHPAANTNTLKGLRAYFSTSSTTTAAAVSFDPMITTGINSVDTDDNDAAADIYSISGQKVNGDISTLPQGIYITKGRKIVIK